MLAPVDGRTPFGRGGLTRTHQALVGGDRVRRGRDAQLIAQQRAEALEGPHRLSYVALRLQRLHQQHVAGLAVGLGLDQALCGALDRAQLGAAQSHARAADDLKGLQAQVIELSASALQPGRLRAGEQPAAGDVERHLSLSPSLAGVSTPEGLERALDVSGGRLDVDPNRFGQLEDQLVAPRQHRGSERRAQPREQRSQRSVLGPGGLVRPQRAAQLLTADGPVAVEHQVGEQQWHLLAAQRTRPFVAAQLNRQAAAQLDTCPFTHGGWSRSRQRLGNVSPTRQRHSLQRGTGAHRRTPAKRPDGTGSAGQLGAVRGLMTPIKRQPSRIAFCECGAQLAGDSEQELFDAAQLHLAHHHPQLLGALELDVVTQMAEERPGALNA